MTHLRPTVLICTLLLCAAVHAHDVPTDFSDEACVPGGASFGAANEVAATADGTYVFTARDDRGQVRYTITPGRPDGTNGLFSMRCALDDRAPFILTGGVMVTARDLQGREVGIDGRRYLSAFDLADVDADGPGGYVREPTGHGPCIRLGDTLPVAPHTEGHVTVPLDVPAGRWLVGVRYMDDRDDQADDAFIALSVRGEEFARIILDRDDDAWREQLFPADLQAGDLLRIDARADAGGADFCRISHVLLQPEGGLGGGMAAGLEGSVLTLTQQGPIAEGVPRLSAEVRLVGRALRCRLRPVGEATAPAGIASLSLLPSEGTPGARPPVDPFLNERIVVLADGGMYSAFIDRFNSRCTDYRPGASALDDRVEAFGRVRYLADSAGAFNEFSEDLYLTASPRLLDVLPSFAGRVPSPGRAAISDRLVFDHWRMQTGEGLERQVRLMAGCGMTDILALWHTWMHYGYDRKQPQFTPANPDRWTDEQFRAAIAACTEVGWRVAVHENYNHMDWDSPYNAPTPAREFGEPDRLRSQAISGDPGPEEAATLTCAAPGEDLSRQPRNAWAFARLADLRVAPGPLSRPLPPAFPISSDKALFYSQIESHRIRDLYATTAGYLDVTPTVRPGVGTWDIHIDLDARNRDARGWDQAYRNAWRLFRHHRSIFEITTGEGGGSATYHAGHIDAVERQIAGKIDGPVLPEHELRIVRPLSLHHGMGYYSRYFPEDAPTETWDFDRYRAMEIAYGHAVFLGYTVLPGGIPGPEAIREYFLLRALQAAYADAPLQDVEYWDGAAWITAEEGLAQGYDFSAARLRITYATGLQIALNFDRTQDWALQIGGVPFVLPPAGWMALCERAELAAGSILADRARRDFASCPDYEYRNTRGSEDGIDGLVARLSGLPGLSERDAPGLLVCLRAGAQRLEITVPARIRGAERLNLTVINAGEEARLPVSVTGAPEGPCAAITYRGVRPGGIRPEVTWDTPRPGTWRLALAYAYTDPQHTDVASRVPLSDNFDGRPLVIGAGEGEMVEGSVRRNADFVEVRAALRYPWLAPADAPLTFTLTDLLWGQNANDDYATGVRLVLTNEATRETVELLFPELGDIERTSLPGLGGELIFPANSITTFELG